MKRLLFVLLLTSQAAWADGYSKFFTRYPEATPESIAATRLGPAPATPELKKFSDKPDTILETFARKGYRPIGYSSFTSGWAAKDKGALKYGTKLGADVVVVIDPQYSETITSSMPLVTPNNQTTYHNGTATVYGSGGSATVYGSGTSTTYGTKTTYIPITTTRYEYGAIYFVKNKIRFGVYQRALNDVERKQLQTNSGVVITLIVDNSPAFYADILVGDILVAINDQPVRGSDRFFELLDNYAGTEVDVTLNRDGVEIKKKVQLQK